MFKIKVILSICIFSFFLGFTSIIKTETRSIEKDIYKAQKKISLIEKDLKETELDYFYLSSPKNLSQKIKKLSLVDYQPMDLSRIYFSYKSFLESRKKITILKKNNEKKTKKK
tara:strand:- start:137 stop:475 length:339 start_codon:yes stop_codon:yes gene_type:complete